MPSPSNKHANRSAQTRQRFIRAAQKLYADRSIDSVSLNEITVAAGQKNRNALQYHFGNRDGLLQAILDRHGDRVAKLRQEYVDSTDLSQWTAAEAAARVLVMPVGAYIKDNAEGVYYVKILSQLAAISSTATNPQSRSNLNFHDAPALKKFLDSAVAHLGEAESRRRLFLIVSITFHSTSDICRAFDTGDPKDMQQRNAMLDQVVGAISALLAAPARA